MPRHSFNGLVLATLLMVLPPVAVLEFGVLQVQAQTVPTTDLKAEADQLLKEAVQAYQQNEYQTALEKLQKAHAQFQQIDDKQGRAGALLGIGAVYDDLGEKQKALEYYNQTLPLYKAVEDRGGEAITLNNIGAVYDDLGEKQKALEYYNQTLPLYKAVEDRSMEATTLNNIGLVYSDLGEKQKALEYYNQALPILKAVGNRSVEATTLNNIGLVYSDLGEKQKALEYYNQALPLRRAVEDRSGEATTLNSIGGVYSNLGEKQKALEYFNQALPLRKAIGDRSGEAITLSWIAYTLEQQQQTTLAIIFYKQSVNVTESLRNDIRGLPQEIQQIYTRTVAGSYRDLANLLLKQDRILEALQVLDLLKVQELQDFLKDIKGNERTTKGIELLAAEQQILAPFNQGNPATFPNLNTYLNSSTVQTLSQQLQKTAATQNLKLNAYSDLQTRLSQLGTRSALFYPLLLKDRLELVLFTPNAPPIYRSVPATEAQVQQAIQFFRLTLSDRYDPRVKSAAQQLYTWLIQPLEAELQRAKIQTIIYAPDGQLRYVPLAALYDGQQWLVEKYHINYVTAFALTNLTPRTQGLPKILAAAYTEPQTTTVNINQQSIPFDPLSAALPEVKALAAQFPQTEVLTEKAFTRQAMIPNKLNRYGIVHLATHGKLVDGSPENSFILLNNGEYITLRELKNWQLPNVSLVVLSACQTALGEKLGSGIEIIGFGYQLQVAQARAAIASLWEVSDDGTKRLMKLFYEQLKTAKLSPTAALAAAQSAMIQTQQSAHGSQEQAGLPDGDRPPNAELPFIHPYYWAPFILIGNGL
jgi:CHAT domain-containing protein/tetratricopeptide (TPR) repeat protein